MTTAAINSTYSNVNKSEMKILNPGSLPSTQGPSEYFTGKVRITPLCQGEEPSCLQCASVGFEPGARTAWHTHPKGQLLVVTDGAGLKYFSKNSAVKCPSYENADKVRQAVNG